MNTESSESTSRVEAFSDGIFGVAITLLALEIGVEEYEGATDATLLHHIVELWPKYVAYFNSFATVLLMWLAHHQMFKFIKKPSGKLILSNGLLLLIVALVPFPTKTVGQFIETSARNVAVEFYTGYFLLVNFAFLLVWKIASSKTRALLHSSANDEIVSAVTKSYQIGILVNFICFGLSFVNPWLGIAANVISWIYWAVSFKE
ncbi:TMEM175 family protein [Spirosoma jeollabukense]